MIIRIFEGLTKLLGSGRKTSDIPLVGQSLDDLNDIRFYLLLEFGQVCKSISIASSHAKRHSIDLGILIVRPEVSFNSFYVHKNV